jgi:hypothetical protein
MRVEFTLSDDLVRTRTVTAMITESAVIRDRFLDAHRL